MRRLASGGETSVRLGPVRTRSNCDLTFKRLGTIANVLSWEVALASSSPVISMMWANTIKQCVA